jgi:WD40 repeat protein
MKYNSGDDGGFRIMRSNARTTWWRVAVGIVAWTMATAAPAQQPPTDPILRIETGGQHTAMINRIAVDRAERTLITGSYDKTVRVWDPQTGALRRVLRPPIGPGNEGKINAVAISPDGELAAAGGWGKFTTEPGGHNLYFFNPAAGELVRRVGGLPNVVNHLAWSPDGGRVAAVLFGGEGVRVFRVADGAEVGRDTDYGASSLGAVFTPDGGLVTTCLDGQLRRYDAALNRTTSVATKWGTQPFAVALSPDGNLLVVGYEDSTAVDFFDAKTLQALGSADTTGVSGGNLGSVAFAHDGARLLAGGRYWSGGYCPVLSWPVSGGRTTGAFQSINAAKDVVMDLTPLAGGSVVFGAGDPMWGVVSGDGTGTPFTVGPATADLRDCGVQMRVSDNAEFFSFDYDREKVPATFSLADRSLRLGAPSASGLASPRTSAPGIAVTDWYNTTGPQLNGRAIALRNYESARSLAIAPDGATFALGAEWSLRLFAADGTQRWENPVPEVVWGVNIPADGRTVVAAFGDGTIRWFRHSDGAELLAFFPHGDQQRWVLWTPTGYYDCSAGAEELIGWHVNNGLDKAADFFPASRFRDQFYRPDVIDRVLQELDEGQAVRLANQARGGKVAATVQIANALPPVVTVASPLDGATVTASPLMVSYSVRTAADAPVTRVWALVDGRPVESARGLGRAKTETSAANTTTLSIPIPERDCVISLLAENRHGISVPFALRVKWVGQVSIQTIEKPSLYALAVGVSKYRDSTLNLRLAAKDAEDFAKVLAIQRGGLYGTVEGKFLVDDMATRTNLLDGLKWLNEKTTSKDLAVLFLAGHGFNDVDGTYYFLTTDAVPENLKESAVGMESFRSTVSSIRGKVLIFADSCHSGNILGTGIQTRSIRINGFINELSSAENGAVIFTASTGRQLAVESTEWGNGAFTLAAVEGLRGRAVRNGRVTVTSLGGYMSDRVRTLTNGKQTPTMITPRSVPDFPIALGK